MKQEDYVSFDVAKLLKGKGYDEVTRYNYITADLAGNFQLKEGNLITGSYTVNGECKSIAAPSLYQTQKWLREKHNLSVEPYTNASGYCWQICKAFKDCTCGTFIDDFTNHDNNELANDCGSFDTYEQALNEGIKEALKKI